MLLDQIQFYEGIKSTAEQGAAELGQLVDKFGATSPVFIVGDFNVDNVAALGAGADHLGTEPTHDKTNKINVHLAMTQISLQSDQRLRCVFNGLLRTQVVSSCGQRRL